MDEQSPTYSNAYQSAVKAGYSPDYANQITAMGNEWLQDVIRPQLVSKSEVIMGVKRIANSRRQRTGDRLKGYELLGKHLKLWGGDSVIGEGITITLGSAKPETIEGELVDTPLLEAG